MLVFVSHGFGVLGLCLPLLLATAAGVAEISTEIPSGLMNAIPLLSLEAIRRADDAEAVRQAVSWTEADTVPFYTLLDWAEQLPCGELAAQAAVAMAGRPLDLRDLFLAPEKQRLRPIVLEGVVKRVVETPLGEAMSAKWNRSHYYQLYLFPRGSDGNPVVACVPELPAGMVCGDGVAYETRLAAVYYKLWVYESQAGKVQAAPVVLGRDVELLAPPTILGRERNISTSLTLCAVLVAVWFCVRTWRTGRDRFRCHNTASLDYSSS